MERDYVNLTIETYSELIREDERKKIEIEHLTQENYNLRTKVEDLEVTIEHLSIVDDEVIDVD